MPLYTIVSFSFKRWYYSDRYSNLILMFLHSLDPGCCCKAILPLATFAKLLNDGFLNLLVATSLFHSSLPICPS